MRLRLGGNDGGRYRQWNRRRNKYALSRGSDAESTIENIWLDLTTSRRGIVEREFLGNRSNLHLRKFSKTNWRYKGRKCQELESWFGCFLVFIQLYELVFIFAALFLAGAILFCATFAALFCFPMPKALFNQLTHAIMHVNSCSGWRAYVENS